jgi:hypothetical protein
MLAPLQQHSVSSITRLHDGSRLMPLDSRTGDVLPAHKIVIVFLDQVEGIT